MADVAAQRATHEAHSLKAAQPDRGRAARLGDRLRGEVLAVLEGVPRRGPGVSALSRTLDVDRSLCHRVLVALRSENTGEDVLRRMPGADGLEQVVRAAVRLSGRADANSPALGAVEEFRQLIWDVGGSHAKLVRWLQGTGKVEPNHSGSLDDEAKARRAMVDGAAQLLGYDVDTIGMVAVTRPMPSKPECIEGASITSLCGLRSKLPQVVFTSRAVQLRHGPHEPAMDASVRPLRDGLGDGDGLVRSLSTKPLPIVSSEDENGTMRQFIKCDATGPEGVDIVTARQWTDMPHPAMDVDAYWAQSCSIARPGRRLIFDVYMHRSMAMISLPSVAPLLWRPDLKGNPLKHWDRRVGTPPTLELLGRGLDRSSSTGWTRHAEMTRELFSMLAWNPADFVGFRCDVAYPVWSAAYFMVFEFAGIVGE